MGFFGLIRDWVDLDLLADVARRRPDWHLVLIGDSTIELALYQGLANMHFLGRKPYADLPAYCKEFDAGLVPFKINELTKAVNPIKLREYLAAGLPVVSTPLPEVKACGPWVRIAADAEEFRRGGRGGVAPSVEHSSGNGATDDAARSCKAAEIRSAAMRDETWPAKVAAIWQVLSASGSEREVHRFDGRL